MPEKRLQSTSAKGGKQTLRQVRMSGTLLTLAGKLDVKSLLIATAAIAFAALSSPTYAGWQNAEWGMTPEQVSVAVPGLRSVRFGASLSNARKRSVRDAEIHGIAVEAEYFYGQSGLAFIRFDVPFRRCQDLVEGLVAQHGQPTEVSDQVILKLLTWEDAEARNKLVLIHSSAGICDLRIRSIAEMENSY